MSVYLLETQNTDPTLNLAIEEALLLKGLEKPALFLWQNAHTVVIGRAQNAWKECRSELLAQENGTLVRRSTGGGAVYHDLGNLNFSFVMPTALYDVGRQLNVIRQAVASFGIDTLASGRNDIVLAETGAKFSGNAFRHAQGNSLHHGTILMDVDMSLLGRYLQPSVKKLAAKGVESVRARVGNLREQREDITIDALKSALFAAFEKEYGTGEIIAWQALIDQKQVYEMQERYRSWEWTYGKTPAFDLILEARLSFGMVELHLNLKSGLIVAARCFSDANDPDLAALTESRLIGCALNNQALYERLSTEEREELREMADWLKTESF